MRETVRDFPKYKFVFAAQIKLRVTVNESGSICHVKRSLQNRRLAKIWHLRCLDDGILANMIRSKL